MSTISKKPATPGNNLGRRPSTDPSLNSNTPSRRSPTPSSAPSTNGVARTRSIRGGTPVSARAAMQRAGAGASNLSTNSAASETEDDSRAEAVSLLDELKERLRASEINSDRFEKEAEVLQSRLDEALLEQGKLEDRLHETEERLEISENEKREMSREMREMESIYEAERVAMTREKEDMANREEEMQTVIQRLKDSLSQRANLDDESRISRHSNNSSPSIESGHFAPSAALHRSDSRNNSKLILQKDRLIESLRLELAEAQIKLVETENMGGGRLQEVERLLLETRMTNARLMEDNESFQLLLSEKTLNGDFTKNDFGYMSSASNADALSALEGRTVTSSLADELDEAEGESYRRLESELKSARAENKALTLYINKIIERLLQHKDFEAILDQSSDFKPGRSVDKDLPPPPPPKDTAPGTSLLQRAKSVAMGAGRARPRPMSQLPAAHSALTNPDTAPSIPFGLGRSSSVRQSRPQSEQFAGGAANVVNQMYKGPTAQVSPPLHGPQTPRTSQPFFAPPAVGGNPNTGARYPSGGQVPTMATFPGGKTSETSSTASDQSGDISTPPSNSPPRPEKGATFAGNKPRPLRLVQDHNESIKEEQKTNKRASWVGWAQGIVGAKKDEISTDSIKE